MASAAPRVQAVFWDIDGTLIDTEELHYQVIADWCRDRGFPLTPQANDQLLGKSMAEKWEILSRLFPFDSDEARFRADCARIYEERVHRELERSETVAVFRRIQDLGIPQACVSNGDPQVVTANLKALGLSSAVAFTISGEDVSQGKPAPEPYLLAAQKLGLSPDQCMAVEDSRVGVASAKAAGMVAVGWPAADAEPLEEDMCTHLVTDPGDFPWHHFPA